MENKFQLEPIDLSELESVRGGFSYKGCIIANGKCSGGNGCVIANGQCAGDEDDDEDSVDNP